MEAALIHFRPEQKRRLARRARKTGKSFSQEVRDAVDFYLELPPGMEGQLEALASEANKSLDRTIARLDHTIATLDRVLKRPRRKR